MVQPILLHEPGSLQGNETVRVGSGPAAQPHGRVTTDVVAHWGTRHVVHAVAVAVRVGQLTLLLLQGLVTVAVVALVTVRTLVLMAVLTLVLVTVDVTVTCWM